MHVTAEKIEYVSYCMQRRLWKETRINNMFAASPSSKARLRGKKIQANETASRKVDLVQ